MKTSEVITALQEHLNQHGDTPVYMSVLDGDMEDFIPVVSLRFENAGTIFGSVLSVDQPRKSLDQLSTEYSIELVEDELSIPHTGNFSDICAAIQRLKGCK